LIVSFFPGTFDKRDSLSVVAFVMKDGHGTMMSSSAKQIEQEVEQRRHDLSETLVDLRQSLRPEALAAQMKEEARNGSLVQNAVVPALILGAGAACFIASRRSNFGRTVIAPVLSAGARQWATAGLLTLAKTVGDAARLNPDQLRQPSGQQAVEALQEEPCPGADATSPVESLARGWKQILWRVYKNVSSHRVMAIAAGVTFYSLLAIFPAIAALVSLYGFFADTGTIATHLDDLAGVLPGGAIEVVRDQMIRVASQGQGTLSLTFAISLATSLWSANTGMKAFFDALNIIYGEEEKRGFFTLNALSLLFTIGAIAFLLLAVAAVVVLPPLLATVGFTNRLDALLPLLRWPVLFLVVTLGLAILYRFGPSREKAQWRWITWGSAVSAFFWLAASILFSWYTAHFGSYNATYGSLGAVIGFMIWIWLTSIIFLLGAELDCETERQTKSQIDLETLQILPATRSATA